MRSNPHHKLKPMEKYFYFIQHDIKIGLIIIFVCCCFVVFASLFDFWTACEAVKARKERLSSHPMRKTGLKIIDYLRLILYVLMIDVLGLLCLPFYDIPYFVVLMTLGVLLREGKSMKENYELKKSNAIEAVDMATEIVKCITKEEAEKLIKAINDKHSIDHKKNK